MRDKPDGISECWEDAGLWMENYREAHPDDGREDIAIYLDDTVYKPDSPFWPLRDVHGTLIDFRRNVATPMPDMTCTTESIRCPQCHLVQQAARLTAGTRVILIHPCHACGYCITAREWVVVPQAPA